MSTRECIRAVAAAAAVATALLLAGCETGTSGGSAAGGCDPSGMPGINGCDSDTGDRSGPQPTDPSGDGGWPQSCPQGITVTYDPDTGDVAAVDVVTHDGSDEHPTNVQTHPQQVSRQCLDDLNRDNHQFTTWLNDELDERSGR